MKFYIETERLILRDVQEQDVDGMFELDSNTIVHQYLGKKPIKTKQQAVEIIQFINQQYKELGIGRFATIEKASGEFIGWSGLKLNVDKKEELNGKQNFYDIGYRFLPRYWNKGYATESSKAILDFGFKKLKLKTICGAAEVENIASNRILQKIGLQFINEFDFEGVKVNWYELTISEYKKMIARIKAKVFYQKNKKRILAYHNNRYKNDEKFKEKTKTYYKQKYQNDPNYKNDTLTKAKNRYYEDEDYRKRTIERSRNITKKKTDINKDSKIDYKKLTPTTNPIKKRKRRAKRLS